MMEAVLVAVQGFFNSLPFEIQRDEAPEVDPPYGRWTVHDQTADPNQAVYADEEYGQGLRLAVDCWGETDVEAVGAFDVLRASFKTSAITPTGMQLLKRPILEFAQPLRDPDTRHHRVTSRWLLLFTTNT